MTESGFKLIGPFKQLLTLNNLPIRGPLKDESLEVISNGGILIKDGKIIQVGHFNQLSQHQDQGLEIEFVEGGLIALPGFIDAHTHISFAGSRAQDYAARNNGKSYLEIAEEGGGIWRTVGHTRAASEQELVQSMLRRLDHLATQGITTVEVKSGYGLSIEEELKLLRAIRQTGTEHSMDVIPTCLAAHIVPKDVAGETTYLSLLLAKLVPQIQEEKLCKRFDIFVEQGAFSESAAIDYLRSLKAKGFELTVHGDQFSPGGSRVAIACDALSVDHLEASGKKEIAALAGSNTIPIALPGASIGLGCPFAPARNLLDAGCSLAIASDWNPGSAPMGNLLTQAAILGTFEKLSAAEVFAGITFRAAAALGLQDRGTVSRGKLADLVAFDCSDFQEILYHQGSLKPSKTWKKGNSIGN